jgi:Amt family ammonium transporter
MLGAGILFFGWFGFNGGSALSAGNSASVVILNTVAASCAGICAWLVVEKLREGHATSLGAASGLIAALVAITPACGAVSPLGALVVGGAAGAVCCFAVSWKYRLGYDDALDVVGVHLVGGILGTVLIGFLADPAAPSGAAGLFYGGGVDVLWRQCVAVAAVLAYSFVVTLVIVLALKKFMGIRADQDSEYDGLDVSVHGETAYVLDAVGLTGASKHGADAVLGAEAITTRAADPAKA